MRRVLLAFVAALFVLTLILVAPRTIKDFSRHPSVGLKLEQLTCDEITSSNGDLTLGGTLFLSQGDVPFPAQSLFHSSGTSRRNNGTRPSLRRCKQAAWRFCCRTNAARNTPRGTGAASRRQSS